MRPLHVFLQDRLRRGIDPAPAVRALGAKLTVFPDRPDFDALEAEAEASRPIVFCSLQNAMRMERFHPALSRGVLLPRRFLQHSVYSSLVPAEMRLNPRGLYLPWGQIPDWAEMLEDLFTGGIFLRPDSPMKPYTGFPIEAGYLTREHDLMGRTVTIDPEEMTFLCERRHLPATEWRCWVVESEPVASAGYSWQENAAPAGPAPREVLQAAARLGEVLMMRQQIYTADFVVLPHRGPVLVELNALSTSGWYPGMDPEPLLRALDPVLL